MINKISRFIFSMDFNKYKDNGFVLLLNPNTNYIQFFVEKVKDKYLVLKLLQMDKIQQIAINNTKQQLNEFLAQQNIKTILDEYQFFVEQYNQFDQQQLQDYFVISDKYKMNPIQFNQLFEIIPQSYSRKNICGLTVLIQNGYNNSAVQEIQRFIKSFSDKTLFDNGCIIFTNKIVQRDGHDIGGNYLNNINDFDFQIIVGKICPQFDFYHQFGHYYADKKFSSVQLKQIFNFVKNSTIFDFKDNYYKTNQNECFAQLIAHYYTNELNEQAKKFVQEKILK